MPIEKGADGRRRASFVVRRLGGDEWLQADRSWGAADTAARLSVRLTATPAESVRVRLALFKITGGATELSTLERQERELAQLLDAETREQVFAGAPPQITDEKTKETRDVTADEWQMQVRGFRLFRDTDLANAWKDLTGVLERLSFLAMWQVQVLDAPDALRSLVDEVPEEVVDAIQAAVNSVFAEADLGNVQSLPS